MSTRLLFLAPTPPTDRQGAGALRMLHLLRFLGSRFHVDVIAPAHEGAEKSQRLLAEVCAETLFVPPQAPGLLGRLSRVGPYATDPGMAAAVRERLASGRYGAVQVEKPSMLPYVSSQRQVPLVLDVWTFGNTTAGGSGKSVSPAGQLVTRLTRGLFDKFGWPETACVLVGTEEERADCERMHRGRRVLVVPNGVDCRTILPKADHGLTTPVLLFTADLSVEANVEAALLLASDIFPAVRRDYPQAELRLVGRQPDARLRRLAGSGVVVTGAVPDLRAHLQEATLYIAPHVRTGGVRMRMVEAMAAGLPIITTSMGIEGLKVQPGRDLLIADQPADMIESVQTLLASRSDRERFAHAARNMAEVWYDWNRCLWPLEPLYHDLLTPKAIAC